MASPQYATLTYYSQSLLVPKQNFALPATPPGGGQGVWTMLGLPDILTRIGMSPLLFPVFNAAGAVEGYRYVLIVDLDSGSATFNQRFPSAKAREGAFANLLGLWLEASSGVKWYAEAPVFFDDIATILGPDLLRRWRADSATIAGGSVTNWVDTVAAIDLAEPNPANEPGFLAQQQVLNGQRAIQTFGRFQDLSNLALPPGAAVDFRAVHPGIVAYLRGDFQRVGSRGVRAVPGSWRGVLHHRRREFRDRIPLQCRTARPPWSTRWRTVPLPASRSTPGRPSHGERRCGGANRLRAVQRHVHRSWRGYRDGRDIRLQSCHSGPARRDPELHDGNVPLESAGAHAVRKEEKWQYARSRGKKRRSMTMRMCPTLGSRSPPTISGWWPTRRLSTKAQPRSCPRSIPNPRRNQARVKRAAEIQSERPADGAGRWGRVTGTKPSRGSGTRPFSTAPRCICGRPTPGKSPRSPGRQVDTGEKLYAYLAEHYGEPDRHVKIEYRCYAGGRQRRVGEITLSPVREEEEEVVVRRPGYGGQPFGQMGGMGGMSGMGYGPQQSYGGPQQSFNGYPGGVGYPGGGYPGGYPGMPGNSFQQPGYQPQQQPQQPQQSQQQQQSQQDRPAQPQPPFQINMPPMPPMPAPGPGFDMSAFLQQQQVRDRNAARLDAGDAAVGAADAAFRHVAPASAADSTSGSAGCCPAGAYPADTAGVVSQRSGNARGSKAGNRSAVVAGGAASQPGSGSCSGSYGSRNNSFRGHFACPGAHRTRRNEHRHRQADGRHQARPDPDDGSGHDRRQGHGSAGEIQRHEAVGHRPADGRSRAHHSTAERGKTTVCARASARPSHNNCSGPAGAEIENQHHARDARCAARRIHRRG